MLTGEIRSEIDSIWNSFWSGGISNPLEVMEQITYLLFLKLAEEREELGYDNPIPDGYQWPELVKKSGDALDSVVLKLVDHIEQDTKEQMTGRDGPTGDGNDDVNYYG